MRLMDAIKKRKSVNRFDKKKPRWERIIRAIDAARFAPSAGNNFVARFILVQDEKKLKELAEASQQDFVKFAKFIVVVVSNESDLIRDYGERGKRYAAQQAGAAIENFLLALTEQKLATTWIGHLYNDQIKRALSIPDDMTIEAIFPIGLETKIPIKPKRKMDLDDVIYFDKWKNRKMAPIEKFSRDAI
jgi:nitroreductase